MATEAPPAIYVTDETARRLARDRVAAVAVFAEPDTDPVHLAANLRTALAAWPQLRVLTGDDRAAAEPDPHAGRLVATASLLGNMAGVAGCVAVIMVAGAFALAVAQRRREFALLRTAGATPRQVRRVLLGEACGVGLLGGLAGSLLGATTAPLFGRWLARVGLAPPDFAVRVTLWPVAAALGLGLVAALGGAVGAARRAARLRPIEALRESTVERVATSPIRWLLGLGCLAGTGPIVPRLSQPAGPAYLLLVALLLLVGCALLARRLAPPLVRLLGAGARGPVGLLARRSALAAVSRTASTATPVLLTVGLAGSALAGTATISAAQAQSLREHVTAPVVVTGPMLGDGTISAAAGLPGVSAAVPVKQTTAYDRDGSMIQERIAWYLDGAAALHAVAVPVIAGSLRDLTGDSVAIARSMADLHGWSIGSAAEIWLGDGAQVVLRVAAIAADRPGLPAVLLPWALAAAHSAASVPDAIYLALSPTADREAVAAALLPLGGELTTTDTYLSTLDAEFDRLSRLAILALIGLALTYTGIGIANTQLIAATGRASELATLRLAGATRRQRRQLVLRETALASATGALLGVLVTVASLAAVVAALSPGLVSPVPVVVPGAELLAITAASCLLAVGAALATTRTSRSTASPS